MSAEAAAGELEEAAAAAADALADLSAEYERRGPWCGSVPAGVYSQLPVVVVPVWAGTVHALIETGGLDGVRSRLVSRDYLHRLCELLAANADFGTGRNCMPGHEELGAQLGRPTKAGKLVVMAALGSAARDRVQARIDRDRARQVSNALAVLMAAGLLRCVEPGRMLTFVEKVELYANGVDRRYARAVYALTLPRQQPVPTQGPAPAATSPVSATSSLSGSQPVDNRAAAAFPGQAIFGPPRSGKTSAYPPGTLNVCTSLTENNSESTGACEPPTATAGRLTAVNGEQAGAARRPAPKRRAVWELDRDHWAFVIALRRALPDQLGGESVRKLAGTTKRFYDLGWDPLSVAAAIVGVYDQLGRRYPTYRPGKPAAWLGWVLKQVDHTITPAVRRYEDWATEADTELCPHDWPGGARISAVTGTPKCPSCRRLR